MYDRAALIRILALETIAVFVRGNHLREASRQSINDDASSLLTDLEDVIRNRLAELPIEEMGQALLRNDAAKAKRLATHYGELSKLSVRLHIKADRLIVQGNPQPWREVHAYYRKIKARYPDGPAWNRRRFIQEHQLAWPRCRQTTLILGRGRKIIELSDRFGLPDLARIRDGDLESMARLRKIEDEARVINEAFARKMEPD